MKLPRFGIKALLIVSTAIALWLSTFAGYRGAEDVRASIMLAVTIAAGAAAFYSDGAKRAFWGGVFAALLVMGTRATFTGLTPRMQWVTQVAMDWSAYLSSNPSQRKHYMEHVMATVGYSTRLVVAALIGLVCTFVYRQSQDSKDANSAD